MSRLGKGLKNRFLAMALTGAMVMTSITSPEMLSFAEESSEAEVAEDAGTRGETKNVSEEAAEDEELKQRDSKDTETEDAESKKSEAETTSKKESTTAAKEDVDEEVEETKESASDAEESQENAVENKANSTYGETEGNDESLVKYNMEGFAASYKVTGGGLLMKGNNDNYRIATNEKEFLDAILAARNANGKPVVIEITRDMNLGNKELDAQSGIKFSDYNRIISADIVPLLHPTLIDSGVSKLLVQETKNLTIFSKNGSSIKHCVILIKKSENIMIRNIAFDELWEWDEDTSGDYDRNDWDYMCVQDSDGIWIDHCTFYKSYDGVVDVKFDKNTQEGPTSNVTISWCRFLPSSEGDTFFNEMIDYLDAHKDDTDTGGNKKLAYYNKLLAEGHTKDTIWKYAYGQKKTSLLGQDDTLKNAKGIKATYANNYYLNSMDRMPRLRWGTAHEYNCVLDAQQLCDWKSNALLSKKITTNGALSVCEGKMLLENCYIKGISLPLISGNSESDPGWINAVDSRYYIGTQNKTSELTPKNNNNDKYLEKKGLTEKPAPLITDADEFRNALPYSDYIKYDAEKLNDDIVPFAGAGKLTLSEAQWEKTSYGKRDTTTQPSKPEGGETVIVRSLSANELETGEKATEVEKNGFTIKAKDGKTVTVSAGNASVGDQQFTQCIALGGSGAPDSRSIHFTAEKAGTLTVYAMSGSEDRILGLYKYDGSQGELKESKTAAGANLSVCEYKITETGNYYIASTNKGINIYYIAFSVKKTEDESTEGSSGPEESSSTEESSSAQESSSTEESSTDESSSDDESTEEPSDIEIKTDTFYGADEGTDNTKTKYNMEGYAADAQVTGGGLLKEGSANYYKVTNEQEFIDALNSVRSLGTEGGLKPAAEVKPAVIEITEDLNLGCTELLDQGIDVTKSPAKTVIQKLKYQPLMHPTLKKTGVSFIKLNYFHNLTIYSKNGASIKHCAIIFEGDTSNIIIRNITFDELWEWDEKTSGKYDKNEWDYITVGEQLDRLWIDHCTFYKAYDGIIDIAGDKDTKIDKQRVTISWCEFLPGSKDNTFFNEQMNDLETNKSSTTYYKSLRNSMSAEDVRWYTYGQKKTHLFGSDDSQEYASMIRTTLANNYYKNSMDRMPRLRFGKTHEYNCILDSQELYEKKTSGVSQITSQGALSNCGGELLLENCYIKGIQDPLISGNDNSNPGYINAVESIYDLNGVLTTEIAIRNKSNNQSLDPTLDADAFKAALPYSGYITYDASKLSEIVMPFAGAGKLDMTTVQWERTKYNAKEGGDGPEESSGDENSSTEESSSTNESGNSGIQIFGLKDTYEYTGAKIIPDIEVYDYNADRERQLLAPGVDYTVKYSNNVNLSGEKNGPAKVTVTGKGNYGGKNDEKTFRIVPADNGITTFADLKGAKIGKIDSVEYTGEAQYPNFELTLKNESAVEYKYDTNKKRYVVAAGANEGKEIAANVAVSNNINKGTATILISTGQDDKGKLISVKKTFKITAVNFKENVPSIGKSTGKEIAVYSPNGAVLDEDSLAVKCKGKDLRLGRDYTVKYSKNKKVGEATVTVTGKGNYTGKASQLFDIEKAPMTNFMVAGVIVHDGIKQVGKIKKATVVNRKDGSALKPKQYQLKFYTREEGTEEYQEDAELKAGDFIYVAAVAIDAENLDTITYNETAREKVTVGKDISKAKFTIAQDYKKGISYTGKEIKLEAKHIESVTYKNEPDLHMNEDYEIVSYTNNINKGTATAVIKGINKYSGTKTIKFKIKQQEVINIKWYDTLKRALSQLSKP